ncbi:MAG: hypothetical protein NT120_02940, partial [Candidatus Aenigmarchaeota archaeon]|nr:hypothetical protein [Candidatus Aenigmarchaeota archaeon]
DKLEPKEKRFTILHFLDRIEPTLVSIEEQMLPEYELRRLRKYIYIQLKKAEKMMKEMKYYTPAPYDRQKTRR